MKAGAVVGAASNGLAGLVDRVIAVFDPIAAVQRQDARNRIGGFEAAKTTRLTNVKRSTDAGDSLVEKAGRTLRERARWLDENHDVAIGILDVLVNNIVGTGIGVEPQVKSFDGTLHADVNDLIHDLHTDWASRPDVTWQHDLTSMDRLACLHWLRDGEAMGQLVSGDAKFINHGTDVPFSVELLEADFLPLEFNDQARRIRQGIERNQWGRPTRFWLYRQHPSDSLFFNGSALPSLSDLKSVPAENMVFLRWSRRMSQLRGNSIFAAVIPRLGDVKMYEDYERVAAQVAAALTVFIGRDLGIADQYCPQDVKTRTGAPLRQIAPGMILEGAPGEKPEIIQSNRPNNQIEAFRKGNLRAAASGTQTGYSSIAKDYSGNYSSQRQELIEQQVHYRVARSYFVQRWTRPIYERFIQTAMLAGAFDRYLKEIDVSTIANALFAGAGQPWIDPAKELQAIELELRLDLKSRSQVIRERGGNPRSISDQIKADDLLFGPLKPTSGNAADTTQPQETANASQS